jgi:hypothetical protein
MGLGLLFKINILKNVVLIILIILSFVILNILTLIACENISKIHSSRSISFCTGKWSDIPLFIFFWPLFLGEYLDKYYLGSSNMLPMFLEVFYVFIISYFSYILLKSDSY